MAADENRLDMPSRMFKQDGTMLRQLCRNTLSVPAMDSEKKTVAISFGSFQGEVYVRQQTPSIYWVLRWVVDFLGSSNTKNFIGLSAATWSNRIDGYCTESEADVPAVQQIMSSSWSSLQKDKTIDRSQVDCEDYSITTFGLLVLMGTWASRSYRANAKWKLSPEDFQRRAQQFLRFLQERFFTPRHSQTADDWVFEFENGKLDLQKLRQTDDGQLIAKNFPDSSHVPIEEFVTALFLAEVNKNFSKKRKLANSQCICDFLSFLADVVERSRENESIWGATGVHQCCSLTTAMSSQEAFSQSSSSKVKSSGRNPGRFIEQDRYAYMCGAAKQFEQVETLGLVADAVRVQKELKAVTKEDWQKAWAGQESTQLAAMAYLVNAKKLFALHVLDPCHRSHNDVSLALGKSGLLKFSILNMSLYNLKYGPWQHGGFSKKVSEAADLLSSLGPNDQLLTYFFPMILSDGGRSQDENSESARKEFLEQLPHRRCVTTKGPKASTGRFLSLSQAHAALDREWSIQAFILAAICIMSSSSGATGDESATQEFREHSTRDLPMDVQPRSQKLSSHGFNFTLQPESIALGHLLHDLRGPVETLRHYSDAAHWSWIDTAVQHVKVLGDLGTLERIGFNLSLIQAKSAEIAQLEFEDSMASQMFSLLCNILRCRGGSQLFYASGIGCLAGLVHADSSKVASSLSFLKSCFETYNSVEATGSNLAKALLSGHFSTNVLMKWIFSILSQENFQRVPEDLHNFLTEVWSMPLNSKLVEDQNKIHREMETRFSSSSLAWLVLQHTDFQTFRVCQVQKTGLKHLPADFQLNSFFERKIPRDARLTMTSDADKAELSLLEGVTGPSQWASHTPEGDQIVLANFASLDKARKASDWSMLEHSWKASLLPFGHAISLSNSSPAMVVHTYKTAALVWPLVKGEKETWWFDLTVKGLYWCHLCDIEECTVLELEAQSPLRLSSDGCLQNNGIRLRVAASRPLLDHLTAHGFCDLSEAVLKKLILDQGWNTPTASELPAEMCLAAACMLHRAPGLEKEEVEDRLLSRVGSQHYTDDELDDDMAELIRDTVLPAEQDKVLRTIATSKGTEEDKASLRQTAGKIFEKARLELPADKRKEGCCKTQGPSKFDAEVPKGADKKQRRKFLQKKYEAQRKSKGKRVRKEGKRVRKAKSQPVVPAKKEGGGGFLAHVNGSRLAALGSLSHVEQPKPFVLPLSRQTEMRQAARGVVQIKKEQV
eukprot:s63_g21.t1